MSYARKLSRRAAIAIGAWLQRAQDGTAELGLPEFAGPAPGFVMKLPREVQNPHLIRVGRDVKLGANSILKATTRFPGGWLRHPGGEHVSQEFSPSIVIGDRVTATAALQVVAFERITIEDDVMFAANVYVSDGQHASGSAEVPYKYQGIGGIAPITIGRGSWIGQNAVIMPGVTIGELAIVGANSVVTRDVPARSVAVGAPARVVRTWDPATRSWSAPNEPPANLERVS